MSPPSWLLVLVLATPPASAPRPLNPVEKRCLEVARKATAKAQKESALRKAQEAELGLQIVRLSEELEHEKASQSWAPWVTVLALVVGIAAGAGATIAITEAVR